MRHSFLPSFINMEVSASGMSCAQVPEDRQELELMKPLAEFYISQGTSIQARAWNDQRMAILQEALQQRLLPAFALELRARMLADARHAALHRVADKLWDYASRAPTQARLVQGVFRVRV
jgi:transcriptional accessory protein Tex/SPT6